MGTEVQRRIVLAGVTFAILSGMVLGPSVSSVQAAQATKIDLQVPSSMYAGTGINMTATLTDLAGARISGWLTWYLNGQEVSASAGGGVSLEGWPKTPGTYPVTVVFNGTANYLPSQAYAIFEVLGVSPITTTTITASPSQSQTTSAGQAQPAIVIQQIDAIPLSLAIVVSSVVIALGIILASKMRKQSTS